MLLIFDKDGVIFDTEPAKTKSYWLALKELARLTGLEQILNVDGEPWNEAEYCRWHSDNLTGKSRQEVIHGVLVRFHEANQNLIVSGAVDKLKKDLSECGGEVEKEVKTFRPSGEEAQVFSALRLKFYNEMPLGERARPIEPVIGLMKMAIRAGNHIALITESEYERTVREIEQLIPLGLNLSCFRVIACKDGVYADNKKAAEGGKKQEMYKTIMSLAACESDQCLVVEDTDKGQAAALAAGLACFKVSFPGAS